MVRHITCKVLCLAGFVAAATPLAAAEPGRGGIRQQPLESRSGDLRTQPPNPGTIPGRPSPEPISGSLERVAPQLRPPASRLVAPEPASAQFSGDNAPRKAGSVTYKGTRYIVSGGVWYEQRGSELVAAAAPPAGLRVEDLPDGYELRWVGGVPYFYADGLYYVWRERARQYEILQAPPAGERSSETDADAGREPGARP